jgi:hypothetical protein
MRAVTDAPLVAYPNAGLPITNGDDERTSSDPEAMARDYPALLDAAATSWAPVAAPDPEHIRLIAEVARARRSGERSTVRPGPRAVVLDDFPPRRSDEVLRFQGYKKGSRRAPPDVRAIFDEALAEGERLMRPGRCTGPAR